MKNAYANARFRKTVERKMRKRRIEKISRRALFLFLSFSSPSIPSQFLSSIEKRRKKNDVCRVSIILLLLAYNFFSKKKTHYYKEILF